MTRFEPIDTTPSDLPPISWCDPAFDVDMPVSPWRFMIVGCLSVLCVGALLLALLAESLP